MAAADWVDASRDDLNHINVFPVPDGDTGTNFAATLRAVATAVAGLNRPTLPDVTHTMAEACVLGAHGNSGLLLSQFLLGFREGLHDYPTADTSLVATAIRRGADRLRESLDDPVEGTILTVCRDVADAAERLAATVPDFVEFIRLVVAHAHESLARTPELLDVLKVAGVVDAGGKGFVRLLEGIEHLVNGTTPPTQKTADTRPAPAATVTVDTDRDYRYCTEVLARNTTFPPTTAIRAALRALGGSIVVLATDTLLKIHVHTNTPDAVFELAARWGTIEQTKADDMREQHRALHHEAQKPLGIVTDSSCDLPDADIDRTGMVVVPIRLTEGRTAYFDRVDIRGEEVYDRMEREGATFQTSQPAPGAFAESYRDALSASSAVLCLTVARALSGTFDAARIGAQAAGADRITVFDSRTVSLGLGMLGLLATELAEHGWPTGNIVAELDRVRDRSGALIAFDTLENLIHSGRLGRARGWIGTMLQMKPIVELSRRGEIVPVERVRGRALVAPRLLELLRERLTPRPTHLRLGVVHANAPEIAERVGETLVARYRPEAYYISSITAALGVHTGPGAWGVFYQVEDGRPDPPRNN